MEPSKGTIDSLNEEVLRLVRLVEALHRLSQIDSQSQVLKKERMDIYSMILQLIQKEQTRFDQKRIRIKVEGKPTLVTADSDQMVQVLQNLLQNALQYTSEGGEAAIRIEPEVSGTKVIVFNSGEGIKKEDLPHIFERFYRSEKSRSREWGGAGIGLAIVKQIIEAHGGTVGARSESGLTEIWFALPT